MKKHSLTINFFLYNLRSILDILLPMVTFAYVTRIFGPEYLGKLDFANSINYYFIPISSTSIHLYALRVIARTRNNKIEMSQNFFEVTCLLGITTFCAYIVYFMLCLTSTKLADYRLLLLIISPNILLNSFSYEWFFQGVEDQFLITVRSCLFRCIYIVLIFVLIKDKTDYLLYAFISVGINGLGALFYIGQLRKYVQKVKIRTKNILCHFKSAFFYVATSISASISSQLDVTMLGLLASESEVAFYTTATRLSRTFVTFINSLSVVVAPRTENLLAENHLEEYNELVKVSVNITMLLGIPLFFGCLSCSNALIYLFAGEKFIESALLLKFLAFMISISAMAGILEGTVLLPHKLEKIFSLIVLGGAIVNGISNYLLIPRLGGIGAVFASMGTELLTFIAVLIISGKYINIKKLFNIDVLKYLASAVVMFFIVELIGKLNLSLTVLLIIKVLVGALVYFGLLALLKASVLKLLFQSILSKFTHRNAK